MKLTIILFLFSVYFMCICFWVGHLCTTAKECAQKSVPYMNVDGHSRNIISLFSFIRIVKENMNNLEIDEYSYYSRCASGTAGWIFSDTFAVDAECDVIIINKISSYVITPLNYAVCKLYTRYIWRKLKNNVNTTYFLLS